MEARLVLICHGWTEVPVLQVYRAVWTESGEGGKGGQERGCVHIGEAGMVARPVLREPQR